MELRYHLSCLEIFAMLIPLQVLREFNHVNPQDDEEGKEFSNTRVIKFIKFVQGTYTS